MLRKLHAMRVLQPKRRFFSIATTIFRWATDYQGRAFCPTRRRPSIDAGHGALRCKIVLDPFSTDPTDSRG